MMLRVHCIGANRWKLNEKDREQLRGIISHLHEWNYSPELREAFEKLARKYGCWDVGATEAK